MPISAKQMSLAKEQGIVTPVTVRETEYGYELLAGLIAYRIALFVKIDQVPAFVLKDISEVDASRVVEIEQGLDRTPLDDARMMESLVAGGMSVAQAATVIGQKRQVGYHLLSLMRLIPSVQKMVEARQLEASKARLLIQLDSHTQLQVATKVVRDKLSYRATDHLIKKITGVSQPQPSLDPDDYSDPNLQHLCQQLSGAIGAPVTITDNEKTGAIYVEFASIDVLYGQLLRLCCAGRIYSIVFDQAATSGRLLMPYSDYQDLDILLSLFGWEAD